LTPPDPDARPPTAAAGAVLPPMRGHERLGRTFFGAPQSVTGLVSAALEPAISVALLQGLLVWNGTGPARWATAMSLMIIALTFPGRYGVDLSAWRAAVDIGRNWALLLAVLALCGHVLGALGDVDWPVLVEWAVAVPVVHWAARMLLTAVVHRQARRDARWRTAVVVGAGSLGVRTAHALARRPQGSARVVGFFDDRSPARLDPLARDGLLGDLSAVGRYVDKLGIREVYITLPIGAHPRLIALVDALQATTASLYLVPDVVSAQIVQGRLQELDGLAVVGICESPFTGTNELIKRASDLAISALLLLLGWPLLLAITIAIRASSPGPAWLRQRRSGLDGNEIVIYAFRTARTAQPRPNDEAGLADDTMLTPIGRLLQRTGLDALPQLVNVLLGQMSMVGPSAHAVADNNSYRQRVRAYMVRYKARPGLTGWAQIHHQQIDREPLDAMRQRIALDLDYLRHWSLGLDLHILRKAVGAKWPSSK